MLWWSPVLAMNCNVRMACSPARCHPNAHHRSGRGALPQTMTAWLGDSNSYNSMELPAHRRCRSPVTLCPFLLPSTSSGVVQRSLGSVQSERSASSLQIVNWGNPASHVA